MKKYTQMLFACAMLMASTSLVAQDYVNAFKLGSSNYEEAHGLALDGQGNIYLSGNFENTVDFDPGSGEVLLTAANKYDAFIAKYDADWNYIWAISISGSEWIYGRKLVVSEDGHVYIAGYFAGEADFDPGPDEYLLGGTEMNAYVAKYDTDGNFVWAFMIGNDYSTIAYDLAMDQAGNLWVSGTFNGDTDFDPSDGQFILSGHGSQDAFMAKYNADGGFIWAGEIGGESSFFYMPAMACDGDNNLYYTSYVNNSCDLDPGEGEDMVVSAGSSDIILIKLNQEGAYQWGFSMGGTLQDQARDIMISNGNVIVTGFFEADIDFDPSSGVANFSSTDDYDAFIAAYTPDGEYLWAKALIGQTFNCPAEGMALDEDDEHNIYLAGSFYGTVDMDPGAEVNEISAQGGWDVFTAKYDHEGNFLWANHAGGNDHDYAYNLLVDKGQEAVMVCGKFQGWAEFDFVGPGRILSASGGFDAFLAAYTTYGGAFIDEMDADLTNTLIYPVPASSELNIKLAEGLKDCSFNIVNSLGSMVSSGILHPGKNTLDVFDYPGGIYFIRLETAEDAVVRKIVVQKD